MTPPIVRYRQEKGWTRREVARRAGVSVSTVATWEHGVMPRASNLWRLAIIFDVDVIELINQILDWEAGNKPERTLRRKTVPACSRYGGPL